MHELLAYARTRILRSRILLLWLLVLGASVAAGPSGGAAGIAWLALASALLIAQFRLWDDLEDIAHDRSLHPDRTLVRSTDLTRFYALLGISIIAAVPLFAVFASKLQAVVYLALIVAFWLLYRMLRALALRRFPRSMLVLSKYPAFVLLLAIDPLRLWTAAVAMTLYLLLAVYEWRHDPELAGERGAVSVIAGIGSLCAALWIGQGLMR
jgi:hypothetical protein